MKTNILFASVAALLLATIHNQPKFAIPEPSFAGAPADTNALDPDEVNDFSSRDVNRIRGNIARALSRKAPYLDVLAGGTLESGLSDEVRSIVQERAVPNVSLTRPEFTSDLAMCGEVGDAVEVGSTEYNYSLQTLRGMGPLVCVKGMRNAFMGSYTAAEDAMRKSIIQIMNADVRGTLADRSGLKLVVHTSSTFEQMLAGDSQAIDTPFTEDVGLPDAPLNFELLSFLNQYMRENFLVDGFEGSANEPLLKFIGSQEIVDKLRDEAGVRDNHRYLAAGSYKVGEETLRRYTWEGPYRGIAFATETQPLRFSTVDADGQPVYIEPEVARPASKGVAARVNPAWAKARFEVALLIGADSFKRLTPAQYTGEGNWKFPAQVSMGELRWKVIEDNGNNVWGDYGRHFYQIIRAYQPMRPHAVCAIAFKRYSKTFNLTTVDDYTGHNAGVHDSL